MSEKILVSNPCGAWCFVLGAGLPAFCLLDKDHITEHRTEINVLVDPKSNFTIYWSLSKDEPDNAPVIAIVPDSEDSAWAYPSSVAY